MALEALISEIDIRNPITTIIALWFDHSMLRRKTDTLFHTDRKNTLNQTHGAVSRSSNMLLDNLNRACTRHGPVLSRR